MKSTPERLIAPSFYRPDDRRTPTPGGSSDASVARFSSTPSTAGPWGPSTQHGGPPAALMARAIEALPEAADRVIGRITVDLLGPVPVAPVEVGATLTRPGRSVRLAEARMQGAGSDRVTARAAAWLFPDLPSGAGALGGGVDHTPDDGVAEPWPETWSRGYLDAMDWRWVKGSPHDPGPGVVWMRPRAALLPGEPVSPVQRLLLCADSASGIAAELDLRRWQFLNTELTVHLLRPPAGEWLCLDAETTLGPGSVGVATSAVYDERGLVARSAQTLLVIPR